MKTTNLFWGGSFQRIWLALACAVSAETAGYAQLAITEVMSDTSTTRGPIYVGKRSDFWELTNFGTHDINLAGYAYADFPETPRQPLVQPGDPELVIGAGQSVIFVRKKETATEAEFRAWWGDCLASTVPVRMVSASPGFDSVEDGVRLWDRDGHLVDRVDFGAARQGVTFISNSGTGEFGAYSEPGDALTCQSATADDWGSPGVAFGPIPLRIEQQPADQVTCVGGEATFAVQARGLPRPRFQWFFNGSPIPGATAASYTVMNALSSSDGAYYAAVMNGLEELVSMSVKLGVTTNPSPPTITTAPMDLELYVGQTARFSVSSCAFPPASYQWLTNGVPVAGATDLVLAMPDCALFMSGIEFCVRVTNALGTNMACARLTVTSKPDLRLTELMANASTNCVQGANWFELTNFSTNAVNLSGYRFSDRDNLRTARVITQAVVLLPGQSAILVEAMTPEAFKQWWGAGNLPPGLPVIPYVGLGFNSERGDEFYLWNAAATLLGDTVDSRSFAASLPGVGQWFDPVPEAVCYHGCDQTVSDRVAFRAPECGDIGSPGYTTNGPPRLVSIVPGAQGARVTWHGVERRKYRLEYNPDARAAGWMSLGEMVATNSLPTKLDPAAVSSGRRFYRVLELAP